MMVKLLDHVPIKPISVGSKFIQVDVLAGENVWSRLSDSSLETPCYPVRWTSCQPKHWINVNDGET